METITFKCRACHTTYSVKATLAGRTAECTKCGQRMQVPYRSPVVKLNEEMITAEEEAEQNRIAAAAAKRGSMAGASRAGGSTAGASVEGADEGAQPAIIGRSFEEYEPLRKQTKAKPPKDPDQPFVALPDILNDIWAPIALALVFYGISAYLVVSYINGSYGIGAGWVIVAMAGLGIYAGVIPMTVRVIEAGADSFDFKPTNALWLQVIAAMSMPLCGILFGMIVMGSAAGAVIMGLIGAAVALVVLSIFFQTTAAKGFQTATMATLGFGVATTLTFLIVWGLSVWFIPRWGMNLPWVKPLTPEEVAALNPRPQVKGATPPPAGTTPAPGTVASTPSTAAPAAPGATPPAKNNAAPASKPDASALAKGDKSGSKLFDVDPDGFGGPTEAAKPDDQAKTADPTKPEVAQTGKPGDTGAQAAAAGTGPSFETPRGAPEKPTRPLTEIARQKEWTITVVSVGQPQVDEDELGSLQRQLRDAKPKAERLRAEANRLESDMITVTERDSLGGSRRVRKPRNPASVIGDARMAAKRAESEAGAIDIKIKKIELDRKKFASQRLIQAVIDDGGAAAEVVAIAPIVVKAVDALEAGARINVRGTAKVDGEKVSVIATAVSPPGASPAGAPAPAAGVAEAAAAPGNTVNSSAALPLTTPKAPPAPRTPVRE